MLTSDLYAKHMVPAKPEGKCSRPDCLQRGMLEWLHCSPPHLSVHSQAHAANALTAICNYNCNYISRLHVNDLQAT